MIRDNPDYFQWASARVPDGLDKGAILYLIARESSVPHVAECDPARSSATYSVSNGLDALAEQHPLVSEGLITISESVRNTATLLGVLVATKTGCSSGQIQQVSNLLSAVCGGFVWDTHLGDYNLRLTFLALISFRQKDIKRQPFLGSLAMLLGRHESNPSFESVRCSVKPVSKYHAPAAVIARGKKRHYG